jgi:hypothetical protein
MSEITHYTGAILDSQELTSRQVHGDHVVVDTAAGVLVGSAISARDLEAVQTRLPQRFEAYTVAAAMREPLGATAILGGLGLTAAQSAVMLGTVEAGAFAFMINTVLAASSALRGIQRRRVAVTGETCNNLDLVPDVNVVVSTEAVGAKLTDSPGTFTGTLVEVLQDLETRYLPAGEGDAHRDANPAALNPAMIVRGALHELPDEAKSPLLATVMDQIHTINQASGAIVTNQALTFAASNEAALGEPTTELLGALKEIVETFLAYKAAQVLPLAREVSRASVYKAPKELAEDAILELETPGVRQLRYRYAMMAWRKALKTSGARRASPYK